MTTFVHLTDLHLNPEFEAHGQPDTSVNLRNAIEMIRGLEPPPKFVVISGDLTDTGSEAEFALVKELLSEIPVPILLTVGNCDVKQDLYQTILPDLHVLNDAYNYSQIFEDVHIILLDSTIPKKISGELKEDQLDWLSETLEQSPDIPKVVIMHHPPTHVGLPILSSVCLQNPEALVSRLENKNVIAIFCGHVHHNQMRFFGDVPCFVGSGLHTHFDITNQNGLRALNNPSFNLCHVEDKKIVVQTVSLPSKSDVVMEISNEAMQEAIDKAEQA